jgi:hypothetical protein
MTTPLIIEQTMFGSCGEHDLQERYGNRKRAEAFYKNQMLSYLNPQMRTFIARQEMFFLSTADGHGECDVSFRAGEEGFVHVLDEKNLVYPEYRGNGVIRGCWRAPISPPPCEQISLRPAGAGPSGGC